MSPSRFPTRRMPLGFTVCVRDDDAGTFEFHRVIDTTPILVRVAAAVAAGRRLRAYTLAADGEAQDRERRYLTRKGHEQGAVAM